MITHEIVICTRSRKESLVRLLESLSYCDDATKTRIRLVFNGETPSSEFLESLTSKYKSKFFELNLDHSAPGLVNARNHALLMMKSDLITFIDDDIGIEREFLTSTRGFFEMNPKIVGSAPLIKSLYGFKTPNELTDKISHKKLMKNSGKVTPSGNNFWFLDNQSDVLQTAEWLPGCCMTYRTSKIKSIQFSTHLQNGPTGGYALGEDVDFSLRAAGLGSLMLDSKTIISHLQALSIRDDRLVMASGLGRWLAYASRNFPAQVSILRVSVRLLLQILRDLLRLGCLKKGSLMDLKVATFTFKSFLKELFFPKLVSN